MKTESGLRFIAWQMLTGDRPKYFGLVLAIAFSTFLMSHQMSIFVGLLDRTRSQIRDVRGVEGGSVGGPAAEGSRSRQSRRRHLPQLDPDGR